MAKKPIALSIRLDLPDGSRFGPGKADLLTEIGRMGSISAAAKQLDMSYPRALRLVNSMNAQFAGPLVEKFQGGNNRGGARLTTTGQEVLKLYREIASTEDDRVQSVLKRVGAIARKK